MRREAPKLLGPVRDGGLIVDEWSIVNMKIAIKSICLGWRLAVEDADQQPQIVVDK
jgi:hypothetical protein